MSVKTYIGWNEVERLCDRIIEQLKAANIRPDLIVGISRGGLVPGVIISHRLNLPFEPISHSTRDFLAHDPSKIFDICEEVRENGVTVMIIDDICDTGRTFLEIKEYFEDEDIDQNKILWTSLHLRRDAGFIPTFYGELITTDSWMVYPYEVDDE